MQLRRPVVTIAMMMTAAGVPSDVFAHASERGHVLLLPTGYYLAGGAAAVAVSFLALALLPPDSVARLAHHRAVLLATSFGGRIGTSLGSFVILAILLAAGVWGSRDPLSNPLPLVVWTVLWVGMMLVQGVFGNIWAWVNPWTGPIWLLRRLVAGHIRFRMPAVLGYWPAVAQLFGFAWFELIDPAPDDPARLALAVSLYWLFNAVMMMLFGCRCWMRRGEALSVLFGMISFLSLFAARRVTGISVGWPGGKLEAAPALPFSGAAFLLLALAAVSFDGFSKTFFWLASIGVNPLEYPGRTELIGINTVGLAVFGAGFVALYVGAIGTGALLAGAKRDLLNDAGLLVWSMAPIALAYHFAHYLNVLAVNGQYALVAISDPFSAGWNLFGTAHLPVSSGVFAGAQSAKLLWNLQAGSIILGHVLAVLAAHLLASRQAGAGNRITVLLSPLSVLMIGYTLFGLWLLSTPTGA